MLADTPCRTAYKVLDVSGNSIDATLQLIDEQGNVMAESKTLYAGMGAFTFTPKKWKKYSVQVLNKQGIRKIFELPQVQESAYGIVVQSRKKDIQISINSALTFTSRETSIAGACTWKNDLCAMVTVPIKAT